jgi:hypothetical protein
MADETPQIDAVLAKYAPYYFSLGRFAQNFADAEGAITTILWHFAQTSPEVSQAVFSGTRGKEAISYVNRICEAKNLPLHAAIKSAFDQFQELNEARNMILHHGARIDGDGLVSSNDWRADKLPRTVKSFPVSAPILDDMAFDAETIRIKLILFTMRGRPIALPDPVRWLVERAAQPWRYKSPPQASPPRKAPDKSAKRPPQQKSSRKK